MDQGADRSEFDRAKPSRIVVVGGTHGNEKGGVWAVRQLLEHPGEFPQTGLEVRAVLGNPEAEARNLRYLDRDLNRCFGPGLDLADPVSGNRETRRALELRNEICPDGNRPDLLVDLHNTTSAMGVAWILTSLSPWTLYLAWKASLEDSRVRILLTPETAQSNVFLPSLGIDEITVEIGPVAHGTHSHWAWEAARDQVRDILGRLSELPVDFDPRRALTQARFEFYRTESIQPYPTDRSGHIRSLIHQDFLGKDFQPLKPGSPVFFDPLEGETTFWQGPPTHPVFVGEAAYVESNVAFHATSRLLWDGAKGVPC